MAIVSSQAPNESQHNVPHQHLDYNPEYASPDYYKPLYQHGRPYYGYHAPENKPASISAIVKFLVKFHFLPKYWRFYSLILFFFNSFACGCNCFAFSDVQRTCDLCKLGNIGNITVHLKYILFWNKVNFFRQIVHSILFDIKFPSTWLGISELGRLGHRRACTPGQGTKKACMLEEQGTMA